MVTHLETADSLAEPVMHSYINKLEKERTAVNNDLTEGLAAFQPFHGPSTNYDHATLIKLEFGEALYKIIANNLIEVIKKVKIGELFPLHMHLS